MDLQAKINKHYGVKNAGAGSVKDIDMQKRIVTGILNTYFWIDSDFDMLVPGAAKKTIGDNGPESQANAKIKHQADHRLDTEHIVGKFQVLKEKIIDSKTVLYFESKIPETNKGNDHLMNYQSLLYDQHSIGFRYKNLVFAKKDSVNETERAAWNEFYPFAINKEKADLHNSFWVVKEIQLFEGSVVMFGANTLTPYLGSKSLDKKAVQLDLINRIGRMSDVLKNGKLTDEGFKTLELQLLQQKQIISELDFHTESSKKITPQEPVKPIHDRKAFYISLNSNLKN